MNSYIEKVCRIGQGELCCRYLTMRLGGFTCAKLEPGLKEYLDTCVEAGTVKAKGDNCEGKIDLGKEEAPQAD